MGKSAVEICDIQGWSFPDTVVKLTLKTIMYTYQLSNVNLSTRQFMSNVYFFLNI